VNNDGSTTYWSNDGTSNAGSQPTGAVSLSVSKGLYSVMLGNTALANMNSIPPGVFNNADVRLRVWFSDGSNGFQLITPDQRIGAVGYTIMAGNVPDGNDKEAKINSGSVNMAGTAWREGTTAGAPTARYGAATVWTGSEVLLWGGRNGRSSFLADGARYNPTTQTWAALPLAAGFQARNDHTAVWTGTDMIIWGGYGRHLDQCEIHVDRGSGWGLLAQDSTPGYTDTAPHPAAPAKWRYKAIYRVDDVQVGLWSAEVSVTVGG
jgi:hypothetical protein